MKRLIILSIALFASVFYVHAQDTEETPAYYKERATSTSGIFSRPTQNQFFETPQRLNFGLQMGTSVGTNFNNGAIWNNFIAPTINYQLTPRLNVRAGTMFIHSNFNTFAFGAGETATPVRTTATQTLLFTQGQYQVNERLSLTGTAYYNINQFNTPRMNPQATNFNSKGMSMYAEFKVTPNFSFGAGAQISNGNSMFNNGFSNNSMLFPANGHFNRFGNSW
jgi:hypothetical protein